MEAFDDLIPAGLPKAFFATVIRWRFATADPPLDPPVIRVGSQGLAVAPHAEIRLVAPAASSCWLVLPISTAPPARSRATTAESRSARCWR